MNINWRLIQRTHSGGLLFPMIVFVSFLAGGLVIWQSWLLSGIVSKVFLAQQSLADVVPVFRWIILIVFFRSILIYLNESMTGRLVIHLKNGIRDDLLKKINRLGPVYLKNEKSGELVTLALQGLDALDAYFGQFLPQILLAALLPVTILIVVFQIDLLTAIVFLVTAPLIPLFMILIGKTAQKQTNHQWQTLSRLGSFFLDSLQGLSTLLILGKSYDRADKVKQISDQHRDATLKVLRITFLSAFALEMIATISTALVAVEIGLRLLSSRMEFQQAFFLLLIAPEFYLPLRNLSTRYHAGMNGLTAAKRVFEVMDIPEPKTLRATPLRNDPPFLQPFNLVFEEVAYQYPGNSIPALYNINLEIQSEKRYAMVGQSGSGKSTLSYLLLRWIEPTHGEIRLNGINIQEWDATVWRKAIGWLPQKPTVFNDSLIENIRMSDPHVSPSQIESLLREVSLDGLLTEGNQNLFLKLNEGGSRLSGGEAQRVALARIALKNAPFLILDEPTAHLDLELEQVLLQVMDRLFKKRTGLILAHRYATIAAADEVIVMKDGNVVQQGTPRELENQEGEFKKMFLDSWGIR